MAGCRGRDRARSLALKITTRHQHVVVAPLLNSLTREVASGFGPGLSRCSKQAGDNCPSGRTRIAFSWRCTLLRNAKAARVPRGNGVPVTFGFLIYDGVEPIELAAYGALSIARRITPEVAFFTIAPRSGVVTLANGLRLLPDHSIDDAPRCDILIVAGGPGWERQAQDQRTLQFLKAARAQSRIASLCTGAMILAAGGLLAGRKATTKQQVTPPERSPIELMQQNYPDITVVAASVVDDGITTGGGVSLCIDAMLYLLERELGSGVARETARLLEYTRAWNANGQELPVLVTGRAGS